MNIFVYIPGRIPPTIFVSSAKWSPILQTGWLWCHSMQMVCTEYSVCVECTVCLLWKKLHRIELHKYCKKTSWTVGGRACLLKDTVYTTRSDLESLGFSVHILIVLLVPVYLCTKIPLCYVYTLIFNDKSQSQYWFGGLFFSSTSLEVNLSNMAMCSQR